MKSRYYSKYRLVPTDINKKSIYFQNGFSRYIFFPIVDTFNNCSAYNVEEDSPKVFPFTPEKIVNEQDAKIILFGNKDYSLEELVSSEKEDCQKAINDLIQLFFHPKYFNEFSVREFFDNLIEKIAQNDSPFSLREELDGKYLDKILR